ncbi:MarR family winged helix-turn-helix transcriptional regulator [Streptacidiphilus neutrinimicus]|uniref:MarR family winged helix-turn-helix transcriptional regulator n=1 Tax=Streptacidiphilus neutrinimicus TaxID=105420 RepID=UPI0005A8E100|nr:winged helix DNA-binding protein [Streptacidiphilus neutrinimicus]
MSTTPTLNGQVIGQAHLATRALLDPVLDRSGTTFPQSAVLNALAAGDDDRARLVVRLAGNLKTTDAAVADVVAGLEASGLLEAAPGDGSRLRLTDAGRARNQHIRDAVAVLTERLYGDIPAEDLATAGRVLTLVTTRANAELAALR